MGWPEIELREVLQPAFVSIRVNPSETYEMVGVYSFGRGLFRKEPVHGSNTSYKFFYQLKSDHFVMSQLFGWEGALALSSPEFAGLYVSPQFPTFQCDQRRLNRCFLGWFARMPSFWEDLATRTRGMGDRRRTLNPEALLSCKIPLPPLDEQRRIVSRIEELAAKTDEARRLRKQTLAEVVAMEQSVTERCFQSLKNEVPSLPFEHVCERITVGHVSSMRHAYRETGVPFLRSQNVRKNRFEPEGLCFIAREFHEANKKSALRPGDVVIVRTGFVGVASVIPKSLKEANCADLVIVRPGPRLDPDYASRFLNSASGKDRAVSASVGSAQKHYNVGAMRKTSIPLPPLGDQHRIVAYIDDVQLRIDAAKALQSETAAELDALMPSILSKAFRGEL
jgi:type I restriction enzyme, S subunit